MSDLKLEIIEQPTRYHRFRYEKEIAGGKLGGLLYGRSEKSCVRLRVSGIDPLAYKNIIIIGGTVSTELYPHPYFMVGDDCQNGLYQLKKDVTSLGGKSELEILLEKVSLVCVLLRPPEKLAEAINKRVGLNFNPCEKDLTNIVQRYNPRNLKPLRLAFKVYVTTHNETVLPMPVVAVSDEIDDFRKEAKLGLFDMHPNWSQVSGVHDIWLYFEGNLPHTDGNQYRVDLVEEHKDDDAEFLSVQLPIKMVRKHLIVAVKPDLTELCQDANERIKCQLVITDTKNNVKDNQTFIVNCPRLIDEVFYVEEVDFNFVNLDNYLHKTHQPEVKRARAGAEPIEPESDVLLELLNDYGSQPAPPQHQQQQQQEQQQLRQQQQQQQHSVPMLEVFNSG